MVLDLIFLIVFIWATTWGFGKGLVKTIPPLFQHGLGFFIFSLYASSLVLIFHRWFASLDFGGKVWLALILLFFALTIVSILTRWLGKCASKIVDIVLWDGACSRIPGAVIAFAMILLFLNGLQVLFLDLFPSFRFPEKTSLQILIFRPASWGREWIN